MNKPTIMQRFKGTMACLVGAGRIDHRDCTGLYLRVLKARVGIATAKAPIPTFWYAGIRWSRITPFMWTWQLRVWRIMFGVGFDFSPNPPSQRSAT
jgi:hypothetical protein